MQVIAAIDLREGACVQLVGGSYDREIVRLKDPVAIAQRWEQAGFKKLHVIDLDAATGNGSNRKLLKEIVAATGMTVQCGGGIREHGTIEDLLGLGANAVILGTRAVQERVWLEEATARFPGSVLLAADVRQRCIVTHGWAEESSIDVADFIGETTDLPLAGYLVTAVHREGLMKGPDLPLMREVAKISRKPVQAAGGIASAADVFALAEAGVAAAVIGMALYTGAINPQTITKEFDK